MKILGFYKRVLDFLRFEMEAQRDVFFLWWPVFFGIGIGVYFGLRFEPPMFLTVLLSLVSLSLLILVWRHMVWRGVVFIFCLCVFGFLMAQFHTMRVATPMLVKKTRSVEIIGTIESLEVLEEGSGSRMILTDLAVEGLTPNDTPHKVRLRVRKDEGLLVGQRVQALGQLIPPSGPILPGGFDFQRYMFFKRIGAVGFVYYSPEILAEAPGVLSAERWREIIAVRAKAVLGDRVGSVTTALLTAERSSIEEKDTIAMRESGLAHILAISGLHVGLFAGVIFFIVRFVLVLIPGLALHYPIKKYAAVLAFCAACFYGFLAGFPVSTQRALIMIGIVFLAIVMDRSPFSLRLVAFAALVVLIINPAVLVGASFQLSFAAVAALIVVYEWLRPYWTVWYSQSSFVKKIALYFLGVCFTTLIASTATAPLALYHFQQVSMLGNVANLIAVPMMAFVIMPFSVMALFAMPFGLEFWPLQVMGWGVGHVLSVAHYFSDFPGAVLRVPIFRLTSLVCLVFAFFCATLLHGRLRLVAILFLLAGGWSLAKHKLPDIVVAKSFDLLMVRGEDGRLYTSSKRKEKFVAENWQKAYGVEVGSVYTFPYEGQNDVMSCDPQACRMEIKGQKISYVRDLNALYEECHWSSLVIVSDFVRGAPCWVLNKGSGYWNGAHAVYLDDMRVQNTKEQRGLRPWAQH